MELRQLRQFVVLAETLNFHRAAERLNMAQPPLSVSLRKLEAELGVTLLDRATRDVRLTPLGRVFLERARRTLYEADEAVRAVAVSARGEEGRLTIGFVGTATFSALPDLVPAFSQAYPKVRLALREYTTTEILTLLDAHALDLGLVRTPLSAASGVVLETVEDDRLVLALPAAHPLATAEAVSLGDIRAEPFIGYSPATVPSLNAVILFACQGAGFLPRVAQEAVQVQTIVSLVASGLGVALVPSVAARGGHGRVVFRPVRELAATPVRLALAFVPGWETPPARLFRRLAAARAAAGAAVSG